MSTPTLVLADLWAAASIESMGVILIRSVSDVLLAGGKVNECNGDVTTVMWRRLLAPQNVSSTKCQQSGMSALE